MTDRPIPPVRSTARRWLAAVLVAVTGFMLVVPAAHVGADVGLPSSMAAIGDSFTAGFASGAAGCPGGSTSCPAVSWSTGTQTGSHLESHYQRILADNPAIDGHGRNVAVPGSKMAGFATQVSTAVAGGFAPDYVTVMLGAADLCFGTTSVAQFTTDFRAGMDALTAASPSSRVLVVSVENLESIRSAVLAERPSAIFGLCGTFFNASDAVRADLMTRVEEYNDALASECATYAKCRFDRRALFDHEWTADEVSTVDNIHPSLVGQRMIAETLWAAGYWAPERAQACLRCAPVAASAPLGGSAPVAGAVSVLPAFTG